MPEKFATAPAPSVRRATNAAARLLTAVAVAVLTYEAVHAVTPPPAVAATQARVAPATHGQVAEERGANVVVSLISIGQGDLIWERFGHNGIRFRDTVTGADVIYNWGLFDPGEKGFMLRFIRGHMRYSMGGERTENFLSRYLPEDRHIWEQVLNLTTAQKAKAMDFVVENEKPANRDYDYNYYIDNCSTRARDVIDLALGGQLRAATDTIPTATTYRSHTRRLLAENKLPYFGVQLVLGRAADRPISRWEEMFLPVRMMQHLGEVKVRGADGEMVPLVTTSREVTRPAHRPPEPVAVVPQTGRYMMIGLVLAVPMLLAALAGTRGSRTGTKIFSGLALTWGIAAGVAGTLALCMWLFSQHMFMHRNETILLLNPMQIAAGILMPAAMLRGRRAGLATMLVRAIAALTIVAAVIYFVLPGLRQENIEMLALALLPNLAMAAGTELLRSRSRLPAPHLPGTGSAR